MKKLVKSWTDENIKKNLPNKNYSCLHNPLETQFRSKESYKMLVPGTIKKKNL